MLILITDTVGSTYIQPPQVEKMNLLANSMLEVNMQGYGKIMFTFANDTLRDTAVTSIVAGS